MRAEAGGGCARRLGGPRLFCTALHFVLPASQGSSNLRGLEPADLDIGLIENLRSIACRRTTDLRSVWRRGCGGLTLSKSEKCASRSCTPFARLRLCGASLGPTSRLSRSKLSYNSRRLPKALHYQFSLRARAAITPDHLHLSTRSIVGRTPPTWTTRYAHRRTHTRLERQAQALGRLQRLPLSQGQVRPRASSAAGLCRLHQLRCFIDRMPSHRQSTQETHGEAHENAPGANGGGSASRTTASRSLCHRHVSGAL
ncbi:hypothetical protein L1887_54112 [Cichorium endivia]|nr:hypothetical protein L1887_54112 [Cichorium endivia]